MDELISPKYQMQLVKSVHEAIWAEYASYKLAKIYVEKWHEVNYSNYGDSYENFPIITKETGDIDLMATLHKIPGSELLKMAVDLGVDTPDFIPSIPTFKNSLKSDFKTAYSTFNKAYKQIETDPSVAIGLANSALESIIKEILKDERIQSKVTGNETLYKLTSIILKEFNLSSSEHPIEIKTIGSSLIAISQSIEKLRSEKTEFHGKTENELVITDTIYTYFVVNSVATVGLFLNSFFKTRYPKQPPATQKNKVDDLPF
jgi:hypothetical protein